MSDAPRAARLDYPQFAMFVRSPMNAPGPVIAEMKRALAEIDQLRAGFDTRPHSRACGWKAHTHGPACSTNCPTCHGQAV